jgi:hypothetical protein
MITKNAMPGPSARDAPRPSAILAAGLALAVCAGGCSFKFAKPPPPASTWPNPVTPNSSEEGCRTTVGPPTVDLIAAGVFGTIAFVERDAITYKSDPYSKGTAIPVPDDFARGIALTLGVGALAAAASAVYGYVSASRCARYQDLFRQ